MLEVLSPLTSSPFVLLISVTFVFNSLWNVFLHFVNFMLLIRSARSFSKLKNRTKRCSCRNPDKCPLENDCAEQKDVIYHAKLEEGDKKQYIGCAQDFKKRYYGHTESFRNEASKTKTTLSNHVWDQNLAPEPKIKWSILAKAPSYKKGNRYCDLCLTEKLFILANIEDNSYLNKRSELAQKCRHKAKFLLQNSPGWADKSVSFKDFKDSHF